MSGANGPKNAAEHAAMEAWLSGSADTTGMLLAVRRALAVQREEIAQAIEAAGTLDGERWQDVAARIARQYGKEG